MANNSFPFNNEKLDNFYDRVDNFVRGSVNSARNLFMDNFRLDIREADENYVLEAELPGVEKKDINLSIDNGKVIISVDTPAKPEEEKSNYIHVERRYRTMRREVLLDNITDEGATANLQDGVLYVTIKKVPKEDTSQKIDID